MEIKRKERMNEDSSSIITSLKNISTDVSFQKNSIKCQKKWSQDEDHKLLSLIEEYKDRKIKWKEISTKIGTKSTRQCYSRYRQIDPALNKGTWTKKEDDELLYYISKHGKRWSLISKLLKTRSSKQIRDRYLNCLDEKLNKKPFTPEEDQQILELIYKYGSNWSKIAREMEGRTGDNIKNRFNWSIRHTLMEPLDFQKLNEEANYNRKSQFSKESKKYRELVTKHYSERVQNPRMNLRTGSSALTDLIASNRNYKDEESDKIRFEEFFKELRAINSPFKSNNSIVRRDYKIPSTELDKNALNVIDFPSSNSIHTTTKSYLEDAIKEYYVSSEESQKNDSTKNFSYYDVDYDKFNFIFSNNESDFISSSYYSSVDTDHYYSV